MKNSEKPKQKDKKVEDKDDKLIVQPANNAAATLKDLFIESLKDIYWAENALVSALPKMAANATAVALKSAINDHLSVTKNQVARLQNVFDLLGEKAVGKKCDAMEGLLKEGDSIIEETMPGAVRDAGIISASQKIEHYEIATYGTLVAFAKALGENDAAKLLTQTLAEEKESDTVLNDVALNAINNIAVKNK
ncbi:ferritin-like domain-containing protein [Flavobacterium sp. PL12]|uniref:YciE/YciF ferroxidase family protein n=1 Tax=Flavobacterium sp. PL12 TaxID=3071718 RepID=UPI00319DD232